jgi:hypothetical protein
MLPQSFTFQPFATETFGPINFTRPSFPSELGHRISKISGGRREAAYLLQRLSVIIQHFSAMAFRSCFLSPADSDL